jgi:hypothetical protein
MKAAQLLGLDPENPRHRDLLEKCISDAQAPPPARGRPKGSAKYSEEALSTMADLVDWLKAVYSRDGRVSDEVLLGRGLWGINGQIIRSNGREADLKERSPLDLSMENTIMLHPVGEVEGEVEPFALCLLQKEGEADTPLDTMTKLIPRLHPRLVWRWPLMSGVPIEAYHWVEPGTFRNLLARGRQIRRASGASGVPQPDSNLHE